MHEHEEDSRRAMIARAVGELRSWCKRYVDIGELEPVRQAIEQISE